MSRRARREMVDRAVPGWPLGHLPSIAQGRVEGDLLALNMTIVNSDSGQSIYFRTHSPHERGKPITVGPPLVSSTLPGGTRPSTWFTSRLPRSRGARVCANA